MATLNKLKKVARKTSGKKAKKTQQVRFAARSSVSCESKLLVKNANETTEILPSDIYMVYSNVADFHIVLFAATNSANKRSRDKHDSIKTQIVNVVNKYLQAHITVPAPFNALLPFVTQPGGIKARLTVKKLSERLIPNQYKASFVSLY